jgi:hypothetical protein
VQSGLDEVEQQHIVICDQHPAANASGASHSSPLFAPSVSALPHQDGKPILLLPCN